MIIRKINWPRFAASLAALTPYGVFFGPNGEIYGPDGTLLVPADEKRTAKRPATRRPQALKAA
jgi:hypothetical protein